MNLGWYFTAPWNSVPIRRGDALGLRAGADYFADLIAPGLNNGTSDARWITLLSWCLKWSHITWHNAGGGDLSRSDDQRTRYAWLRPLELLWIDRTLESNQTTGQLRGRRSIERWRKADRKTQNFAMSADQFRRYRQVGTYGAYRVVFRTVAGLTTGDGWTPADTALKLADLVNKSLPLKVQLNQKNFDHGTWKWGSWREKESRFWTERGWPKWREDSGHGFMPTPDKLVRKRLPDEERRILEVALFGDDSVRRVTAEVLASAKGARSHADLCDTLADSNKFDQNIRDKLAPLPAFTRLSDSAMDAMRKLWNEINHDGEAQAPTIDRIARSDDMWSTLKQLSDASKAWLCASGRITFPHEQVVTRLSETMRRASSPSEHLQALLKHHNEHGGGRRWFREQAGKIVPLTADTGVAASDYRFRLWSVCLLAAQCGVANMDAALDAIRQNNSDDDGDLL